MPLPDFIIIGAMKCGTSTLATQLGLQDGVFITTPKEPNFFSDDPVHARGLGWYSSLFDAAASGDLKGEASTHYTKLATHPDAAARMAAVLDNPKLVYLIRDPVARLVSHYMHEWSMGMIRGPLDAALDDHPELVDYSLYARQIGPYVTHFGAERIHVISLETMQAAPQKTLEDVCAHLGYDGRPVWQADHGRENASAERVRRFPFHGLVFDNPSRQPCAGAWCRSRCETGSSGPGRCAPGRTCLLAVGTRWRRASPRTSRNSGRSSPNAPTLRAAIHSSIRPWFRSNDHKPHRHHRHRAQRRGAAGGLPRLHAQGRRRAGLRGFRLHRWQRRGGPRGGRRVVELDPARPFTAARARNEGVAALTAAGIAPDYLQFVDGDCTLDPDWLATAVAFLHAHPEVAVVCGRRRERYPEASVYNRLCDREWTRRSARRGRAAATR